jgi:threonylcarbamoyladenosine tRNA methylthiotransferase MtaB
MDRAIKKAAVVTLGCKVNRYESLAIKEQLEDFDIAIAANDDPADLYIINTCTVTGRTDSESKKVIRRLKRLSPDSLIAVTGCYAQLNPYELRNLPEVDYVFDNTFKGLIVKSIITDDTLRGGTRVFTRDIFDEPGFLNLPVTKQTERNRAFLKIQDGCESFCSYCIVPYARGKNRSLKLNDAISAVNRFVDLGFKEVVLSGIHIGTYGLDFPERVSLIDLIREIERSTDLQRLRVSSIEPNEISDEFINLFRSSKILCNHLHIPLQSGDDDILKLMNRKYTTSYFVNLIDKLKELVEDIIIGADVIVGFPGETDERFKNTYDLIGRSKIDYLHVFPYSKRKGTKAYDMPGHLTEEVKKERARVLRALSEEKRLRAYDNSVGKSVRVLFEKGPGKGGDHLHGLTRNYLNAVIYDFNSNMFNNEFEFEIHKIELPKGKPLISL